MLFTINKYIVLESCLGSILMVNIRYLNKDFIFEFYLSLKMLTKTGSLKILSGTDSLIFEKKYQIFLISSDARNESV